MQDISGSTPMQRIVRMWWPLAASWMLMAAEVPVLLSNG